MGGRTPDLNTASVALYQLSYCPKKYELGGGEEARTPGLDSAIVALYQLSYTPKTLLAVYDAKSSLSNRVFTHGMPWVNIMLWVIGRLNIQVTHFRSMGLDEAFTGRYEVAHEHGEGFFGGDGIIHGDLEDDAICGVHGRIPQLFGVHFA